MLHNNQWGTICDDYFSTNDANVICQMLNFTQGAECSVSYAQFGRGYGIHILYVHDKNTHLNMHH